MTHKFRWPPSKAIQEIIEHADEIDSLYIAIQYKNGKTGIIASGMSETNAMRVALRFLLDGGMKVNDGGELIPGK